jgi:hypothetical protein
MLSRAPRRGRRTSRGDRFHRRSADAFTAKEYASYYIKVLDEHLPLAIDILADIVRNQHWGRRHRAREESRPRRNQDGRGHAGRSRPRAFTQGFWENHPSATILATKKRGSRSTSICRAASNAYTARNLIVSAVGNLEHERVRDLVAEKFGSVAESGESVGEQAPRVVPKILIRNKELEQSHLCLGVGSYPQNHDDR